MAKSNKPIKSKMDELHPITKNPKQKVIKPKKPRKK